MSTKPYDFLVSDKEPMIYLEHAMLRMKDGFLCAFQGKEGVKQIAPSGHLLMLLGAGTSISQEAAIFCSFNDMQIAFVKGGVNIHSLFMSGRYQNPVSLINQINFVEKNKLDFSKKLLIYRLKILKETGNYEEDILKLNNLNEILLWEARWARNVYKKYSLIAGVEFKRDFNGQDIINERLNILNNALYSVCSAIIMSCSLSPSIAILHGTTRRGGLAFDLADLYKTKIIFDLAFTKEKKTIRQLMYLLSEKLKENNSKIIKEIIKICLYISGDTSINIDEILK